MSAPASTAAPLGAATARPHVLIALGDSTGGIGAHVASLAGQLAGRADLMVWAPSATLARPDIARLVDRGVRLEPVRRSWREQRRLVDGADIVHAHGFHAGARCLPLMPRRSRQILVTTWHNLPPLESALSRSAGRLVASLVARRSRLSLCASSDLVTVALALGSADARLCAISAPALPPPTRGRDQVRAELLDEAPADRPAPCTGAGASAPPDETARSRSRPLLVATARLAPQKRLDILLDAMALLAHRNPSPLLVVAGAGPQEDELAARVRAESLPVRLLGHRSDVADLLAAADVAVSSSDWEARSLVAQEALRVGVPFVGTDVGGVGELVGEAAVLVPAGDATRLADAVAGVLDDPALAGQLRRLGPARAASWPDEQRTAEFVWSCYRELLDTTDEPAGDDEPALDDEPAGDDEPCDTPNPPDRPPH